MLYVWNEGSLSKISHKALLHKNIMQIFKSRLVAYVLYFKILSLIACSIVPIYKDLIYLMENL